MDSVIIPRPDDWHLHLRDDEMLAAVVDESARQFRYAMVMPNLAPPIVSVAQAAAYRERIMASVHGDWDFRPVMTLSLVPDLDLGELRDGAESGLIGAVKYYPVGATTNSDFGAGSLAACDAVLEAMADMDLRLLVHAESTNPEVDIFDREAAFIDDELVSLCDRIPELGVTVEHVSTARGIEFVRSRTSVAASITPHHLAVERSALLANGMRPDLFCKPVINSAIDRLALLDAATSGPSEFFFGSDSAPHPTAAKYGPKAAAGIFNATHSLAVLCELFFHAEALDRLANFVSFNGAAIYGVEPADETIELQRVPTGTERDVPTELPAPGGDRVVMFGSDAARLWECSEDRPT